MGMPEFITLQCDVTGMWLARDSNTALTRQKEGARLFVNHTEALKKAEELGWYVTSTETLSPMGYDERYRDDS